MTANAGLISFLIFCSSALCFLILSCSSCWFNCAAFNNIITYLKCFYEYGKNLIWLMISDKKSEFNMTNFRINGITIEVNVYMYWQSNKQSNKLQIYWSNNTSQIPVPLFYPLVLALLVFRQTLSPSLVWMLCMKSIYKEKNSNFPRWVQTVPSDPHPSIYYDLRKPCPREQLFLF